MAVASHSFACSLVASSPPPVHLLPFILSHYSAMLRGSGDWLSGVFGTHCPTVLLVTGCLPVVVVCCSPVTDVAEWAPVGLSV